MTYIVAGKLKDRTFLTSDCIVIGQKKKTFTVKTNKLESSTKTYYSLTGSQFVDLCIRAYDNWLSWNNRHNDFILGTNSIDELCKYMDRTVIWFSKEEEKKAKEERQELSLEIARIFFLNNDEVVYYDIQFKKDNSVASTKKNTLTEGTLIDSAVMEPSMDISPKAAENIEDYCKSHINLMAKKKGIDFKDRFSHIELFNDGNKTIKWGVKRASDLIAMFNEIDYSIIDDDDFKWDI